jgi:nitroreductase
MRPCALDSSRDVSSASGQSISMLKSFLRRVLERGDRLALPLTSAMGWIASFYYLLLNRRFRREQQAVLAGRAAYEQGMDVAGCSSPLLRRNIHRLEKGLIMRPRQPVFAEEYIDETVDAFVRHEASGMLDAAELGWAREVLREYFAAVTDTVQIAGARRRFESRATTDLDDAKDSAGRTLGPQPRESGVRSRIDFEQFFSLCRQRRSVRWFSPELVPRELVLKALQAASQAPSACNRQPFLFRYFERAEDAQRIAGLAMGTTGYAHQVPALVVLLGDLSCFPHERDRHVIYIDASLSAMQFMLALETLGLASCPINWPDVESLERRMDRELGLPRHLRPVMLIAVGFADPRGGVPASAKKPPELLLKLDDEYAP